MADEDVTIEPSWNMVFDVAETPVLNSLTIHGRLIVQNLLDSQILKAKRVYISATGELLVGEEANIFTKKFTIQLFGQKSDPQTVLSAFIEPTNKSIVNSGKFLVYSTAPQTQYAKLSEDAKIGDSSILLTQTPDWKIDDEIAIASTSQNDK